MFQSEALDWVKELSEDLRPPDPRNRLEAGEAKRDRLEIR